MAKGSKPRPRLAEGAIAVEQEAVEIDNRGRLSIPSGMSKRVSWLSNANSGARVALAVFREPGKIELYSWEATSPGVLARRGELIHEGNLRDLRLLEDLYRRVSVPQDLRLTLGRSAVMHLGLPLTRQALVYIARVGDVLEVMAPTYRDQELARAVTLFPDLPG